MDVTSYHKNAESEHVRKMKKKNAVLLAKGKSNKAFGEDKFMNLNLYYSIL